MPATLGTSGRNKNYAPAFTVPAGMTLESYVRDMDVSGAVRYRMVRCSFDTAFPASKLAAVLTAVSGATPGASARCHRSRYDGAGPLYKRIDIEFGGRPPASYAKGLNASQTVVTSVLANVIAATA